MKKSQKVAIQTSRKNLTNWITQQAESLSRVLGFGFEDSQNAPSTFEEISKELSECIAGRRLTYRVFSGASDNVVYLNKHANYAFRFVHDWLHYSHGLDLTPESEYKIAGLHLESFKKYHPNDNLGFHLLLADTAGQTLKYNQSGDHVQDQLAFALRFARSTIKKIY